LSASFLAFKALLKKSWSFAEEHFKFALLQFTTCPAILSTRLLVAVIAINQNVFLARSLRAGNINLWSRYPLCSIEFLAHLTFTCTGWQVNIQLPSQIIS